jgi:bacterioferritin-associated ferredoxin
MSLGGLYFLPDSFSLVGGAWVYVCICHAVTRDEVHAEIAAGARTEEEVAERCRAGSGCGSCVDRICDMLRAIDPDHGRVPFRVAS